MIKNVYWPSGKVPVIFAMFQLNLNFLNILSKNVYTSNYIKIRRMAAELCPCGQRDGWTDIAKPTVAFRNFVNAPKTGIPRE
jgi:hypothetical protein